MRRLALASGLLILGMLAGAGCSGSSATDPAATVKIEGLSPGDYRDKIDGTMQREAKRAKKKSAGAR